MSMGVRVLRQLLAPLTRSTVFRRTAPKWLPWAERGLASLTGGRLQVSGIVVPSLVLHTIGSKSGQPRESVLMYERESGRSVRLFRLQVSDEVSPDPFPTNTT